MAVGTASADELYDLHIIQFTSNNIVDYIPKNSDVPLGAKVIGEADSRTISTKEPRLFYYTLKKETVDLIVEGANVVSSALEQRLSGDTEVDTSIAARISPEFVEFAEENFGIAATDKASLINEAPIKLSLSKSISQVLSETSMAPTTILTFRIPQFAEVCPESVFIDMLNNPKNYEKHSAEVIAYQDFIIDYIKKKSSHRFFFIFNPHTKAIHYCQVLAFDTKFFRYISTEVFLNNSFTFARLNDIFSSEHVAVIGRGDVRVNDIDYELKT